MGNIMGNHYSSIKDRIGIKEILEPRDSDEETQEVFCKLRPKSPFKFRDLIRSNFDSKKFNRMVGLDDYDLNHEQIKD
jgi:hypothetical protein